MGEDLESLNLKELQQLEQQLESSLKHIRSRKVVIYMLIQQKNILKEQEKHLHRSSAEYILNKILDCNIVVGLCILPWHDLYVQELTIINYVCAEPAYARIHFRASKEGKFLSILHTWIYIRTG